MAWTWIKRNGSGIAVVISMVTLLVGAYGHFGDRIENAEQRLDTRIDRLEAKIDRLQETLDTRLRSVEQAQARLEGTVAGIPR